MAAFGCPQRSPSLLRVYRGSKELASSDWMGRGYQAAFASDDALLAHLDKLQVTRVFVDLSVPPDRKQPREQLFITAMQSAILIAGTLPSSNVSPFSLGKRVSSVCISEIPRPARMSRINRSMPMPLFDCRDSSAKDRTHFFPITLPS